MNKIVLAVLVVLVLGIVGYMVMKPSYSSSQAANVTAPATTIPTVALTGMVKSFTVTGSEFAFSPSTLTVNKGDTVKVNFMNTGKYPHNFTITELNVQSKTVMAGQSDTVTFTADKAGTFQYFCSVPGHKDKGMVGTITIQ